MNFSLNLFLGSYPILYFTQNRRRINGEWRIGNWKLGMESWELGAG